MELIQVVASANHSLAVTKHGEVYSFGDNTYGQCGFPPLKPGQKPPPISQDPSLRANTGHTFGKRTTRDAREMDRTVKHADGIATLWVPNRIVGLSLYKVKAITTGEMHSMALAN